MIKTYVAEITPALAETWLKVNTTNQRNINQARVSEWAARIVKGEWRLTHQGVAFDDAGQLLDGQHRLSAIVLANRSVEIMVTEGLPRDTFDVIDNGRSRTAADALKIAGISHSSAIAPAVRLIHGYDHLGARPWDLSASGVTPADIRKYAERYDSDQLVEAVRHGAAVGRRLSGSRAAYSAAYFVSRRWALAAGIEDDYLIWADNFETGAELAFGDPRLAVASWIAKGAKVVHGVNRAELLMFVTIRSWHASVTGESFTKIHLPNARTWTYRLPTGK
jgi:hypothetical protein